MNTLKGHLLQLCITPQQSESKMNKFYLHSFKVNNIPVEFKTKTLIKAKDGDFVIVAGIYAPGRFKAYSLKKIKYC